MENPLTWTDIQVFEPDIAENLATAMIATAWARAQKIAPCLKDLAADDTQAEVVKSTLRSVVLRWYDTGSGGVVARTAGDFSERLSGFGGGLFRPDEIRDLQEVCGSAGRGGKATTIPTWDEPTPPTVHPFVAPWG
ncbi:hypothetical protein [Nocardia cyriacigeorgica]|uniref:hypothetical protein n=1 Tax=Nocardia cyriacigeorgica TaxID=135487 RepID=UPI0024569028|nr:hypothetical protein [Nocardia cyriacigeorgica]